jgi:DNA-binding response OmpR family regulator
MSDRPVQFATTELITRIKALLRRPGGVLGTTLEAGNVILDTVGREVAIAGGPVHATRRELATLARMMRRFGRIIPKAVLEEKLYGMDEEPERMDHQAGIFYCASCGARFDLRFRPV